MNKLLNFYNDHEKQVILVFGLLVGLGVGLLIGWVIWPTQFSNATPPMLRQDFRNDYVAWVAEEYTETGDLEEAQQRLGVAISGRGRWRQEPEVLVRQIAENRPDSANLEALAAALET